MFRGMQVPMVLRTREDVRDVYQVVGDSWFLGLGSGQGIELDSYKDREIEVVWAKSSRGLSLNRTMYNPFFKRLGRP